MWEIVPSNPSCLTISHPAMSPKAPQVIGDGSIRGRHHSAFDRRDMVGKIEAERAHRAECAGVASVEVSSQALAGILEELEPMLAAEAQDVIHLRHLSEHVNEEQPLVFDESTDSALERSIASVRASTSTKTGTRPS